MRGCILFVALCGFLAIPVAASAADQNGCIGFYDPATRARDADDVYISVEKSDETAICLLIPREVVLKKFRSGYTDGMSIKLYAFEPGDLVAYFQGEHSVEVGNEQRSLKSIERNCLSQPTPDELYVASGFRTRPVTLADISTYAKDATSDLPGYRRLTTMVQDYYIGEDGPDSLIPFSCWRSGLVQDHCYAVGDFNKVTVAIGYRKSELLQIAPAKAMQCARDIAALFRIVKPVGE